MSSICVRTSQWSNHARTTGSRGASCFPFRQQKFLNWKVCCKLVLESNMFSCWDLCFKQWLGTLELDAKLQLHFSKSHLKNIIFCHFQSRKPFDLLNTNVLWKKRCLTLISPSIGMNWYLLIWFSCGVVSGRKNIVGFMRGYTKLLYTIEIASFDWERSYFFSGICRNVKS